MLVTWSIEVDASSPVDAAQKALEMMRDPESTATCFEVDKVHHIDLSVKPNGPTVAPVLPESFDGRFIKWGGFTLDISPTCEDEGTLILTLNGMFVNDFYYSRDTYTLDYDNYLKMVTEHVKQWIKDQTVPPILQAQQT